MFSFRSRILLIDLLKAGAAQFIVLHHLAWFGPLSINAAELGPLFADTIAWFANYGRYAVAVFFVTGGFLAGLSLPHSGLQAAGAPLCLIRERYFRLVLPFMVALLIAALCNIVARPWLPPDLAGHMPTILQFLAHLPETAHQTGIQVEDCGHCQLRVKIGLQRTIFNPLAKVFDDDSSHILQAFQRVQHLTRRPFPGIEVIEFCNKPGFSGIRHQIIAERGQKFFDPLKSSAPLR